MEKEKSIAQSEYKLISPDELEKLIFIMLALPMGGLIAMLWITIIIKFFFS